MQIKTFITVSTSKLGKLNKLAVSGNVIFPIGVPLPIINTVANKCIGLGVVSKCAMSSTGTTVFFEYYETKAEYGVAYYSLYQNTINMTRDVDTYQDDEYYGANTPMLNMLNKSNGVGSGTVNDAVRQPKPMRNQSLAELAGLDDEY